MPVRADAPVRQHHFCALTPSSPDPTPSSPAPSGAADAASQGAAIGSAPSDATGLSSDAKNEGFVEGTIAELRKVVWPSRQQLFSESVAVILMVGLSAASIAALDRFLHWVSTNTFPVR